MLYSGPLFTHQLSHLWIDFRGIQDAFMRDHGSDYFENSRQATYVHQEYARRNPLEFAGYGEHCWGITATDGPGFETRRVNGIERQFYDYNARGAPYGPDDGTLAPWVVVASLPFAPEIVIPTIRAMMKLDLGVTTRYGFWPSFNQTYAVPDSPTGWWVTPYHFGIDQGPVILMIENYRTGLIWNDHAPLPLRRGGAAPGGLSGRLALKRGRARRSSLHSWARMSSTASRDRRNAGPQAPGHPRATGRNPRRGRLRTAPQLGVVRASARRSSRARTRCTGERG